MVVKKKERRKKEACGARESAANSFPGEHNTRYLQHEVGQIMGSMEKIMGERLQVAAPYDIILSLEHVRPHLCYVSLFFARSRGEQR